MKWTVCRPPTAEPTSMYLDATKIPLFLLSSKHVNEFLYMEGSKQATWYPTSLSLLTFAPNAQRMPRFRHAGTPRYIIHVIRDRYGVLL